MSRKRSNSSPVIDPLAQCTHCPHQVIRLSRSFWCPCEDCHPGGLIQGREPFVFGVRASAANLGLTVAPTTDVTDEQPQNDGAWVDPMHSL